MTTLTSDRTRRLTDERATAWAAYTASRDAFDASPTPDLAATVAASLQAVELADTALQAEQTALGIEARMNALSGDIPPIAAAVPGQRTSSENDQYRDAFNAWAKGGLGRLTPAQNELMNSKFSTIENAQGAGTDPAGGFLVPDDYLTRMTEVMKSYGGIMNLAEILPTAGGGPLEWPTNNDTANVGAILAENTQDTELDFVFGNVTLGGYTYTSKIVRVSLRLLQDAAFNLDAWLPNKMGERIGRAAAAHFVAGNGTTQPQGLITGATTTRTTATTLVITFDDLIELQHSVDPAYRTARARFALSDGALKAIRKLKDGQGQYLWQPATSADTQSRILGVPYSIDNNMTSTNAIGARMVAYGDFAAAYVIRQIQGVTSMRLTERYADFLQVGFLSFARLDAKIQNQSAVAVLVGL